MDGVEQPHGHERGLRGAEHDDGQQPVERHAPGGAVPVGGGSAVGDSARRQPWSGPESVVLGAEVS